VCAQGRRVPGLTVGFFISWAPDSLSVSKPTVGFVLQVELFLRTKVVHHGCMSYAALQHAYVHAEVFRPTITYHPVMPKARHIAIVESDSSR
jgi:hypothetical protein